MKGYSVLAIIATIIIVFAVLAIFSDFTNSLFYGLATISGPLIDSTEFFGEEEIVSFEILGSVSRGKTVVIKNTGNSPLSSSDITIMVNGEEASITTPSQTIQPGESIVIVFETEEIGASHIEITHPKGSKKDYYTTFERIETNRITGFCGDNICNPQTGENCRNCFVDCSLCR